MTKEELLQKLTEIEWDDFECKAAQDKLPEGVCRPHRVAESRQVYVPTIRTANSDSFHSA